MKYWQQNCSKDGTTVDFDHAKATWLIKMPLVAPLAFNDHNLPCLHEAIDGLMAVLATQIAWLVVAW